VNAGNVVDVKRSQAHHLYGLRLVFLRKRGEEGADMVYPRKLARVASGKKTNTERAPQQKTTDLRMACRCCSEKSGRQRSKDLETKGRQRNDQPFDKKSTNYELGYVVTK